MWGAERTSVGEKYAVEGAQDPEVLVGVFEKLAANSG